MSGKTEIDGYTIEKARERLRDRRKSGCGYSSRPCDCWKITTPEGYVYHERLKRDALKLVEHLKKRASA